MAKFSSTKPAVQRVPWTPPPDDDDILPVAPLFTQMPVRAPSVSADFTTPFLEALGLGLLLGILAAFLSHRNGSSDWDVIGVGIGLTVAAAGYVLLLLHGRRNMSATEKYATPKSKGRGEAGEVILRVEVKRNNMLHIADYEALKMRSNYHLIALCLALEAGRRLTDKELWSDKEIFPDGMPKARKTKSTLIEMGLIRPLSNASNAACELTDDGEGLVERVCAYARTGK